MGESYFILYTLTAYFIHWALDYFQKEKLELQIYFNTRHNSASTAHLPQEPTITETLFYK